MIVDQFFLISFQIFLKMKFDVYGINFDIATDDYFTFINPAIGILNAKFRFLKKNWTEKFKNSFVEVKAIVRQHSW